MERVVITGIGLVTPNGIGTDATWSSLVAGESGVGPITLFDAAAFPTRFAAEVKGFDASQFVEKKKIGTGEKQPAQCHPASFTAIMPPLPAAVIECERAKLVTTMVHARSRQMSIWAPSVPGASTQRKSGRLDDTIDDDIGAKGRGGVSETVLTHVVPERVNPALQAKSHAAPLHVAVAFAGDGSHRIASDPVAGAASIREVP